MNGMGTVFQSALYKTNAAVVETDDLVLVVDPCWLPYEVSAIRRHADAVLEEKPRPLYALYTHSDFDHIIGCGAFPDARVVASRALADMSEAGREQTLEQIRSFDDDYYVERDYPIVYPAVDCAFGKDGETLEVGGTRLTFYQSPGHNPDGLFTVVEPLGLLIAGDYLSDIEFPYIYHSSRLYEDALHKLDTIAGRHDIRLLLPGHGSPTDVPAEMKRRQAEGLAYIAAMREAVAAGDGERIDGIVAGCRFPRNLGKFHRSNRELFERELRGEA